jgi:hypothetical protein
LNVYGSEGNLGKHIDSVGVEQEYELFPQSFNCQRMSQDTKGINEHGKKLIELCKASGLRMLNGRVFKDKNIGKYTRVETTGCSVVDYVVCDAHASNCIVDFEVGPKMPESDHCPLIFALQSGTNVNVCVPPTGEDAYKYKWDKQCIKDLGIALAEETAIANLNVFYDSVSDVQDINVVADCWSAFFTGAIDQICARRKCINKPCDTATWIDKECLDLRSKIAEEKHIDKKLLLTSEYRTAKRKKKRNYKTSALEILNDKCGRNSKQFWDAIKTLPSAKTRNIISDPQNVCEQLKELSSMPEMSYFDKVFEQEAADFLRKYDNGELQGIVENSLELNILNDNISVEEVACAAKKLKANKSPGLDMIPAEFVKMNINQIKSHLTILYNYILSKGIYPAKWAEGLRVAIPKDGGDIRPITIEPVFGKIFEIIIDNRLNFANEVFSKGDKYNGGFVKGSMTQDNMLILLGCIQKQTLQGRKLYMAFVDFKKAFNFINRKLLFFKIIRSGRFGRMVDLLRNMYSKIRARVKINGSFYDWIDDMCGTNQGGPVSPNMFRNMLADLKEYLNTNYGIVMSEDEILTHILWADDLALVSDSEKGLQEQLDGLFKFCGQFQMIVNELKTKVVIFGQRSGSENCVFNGKSLEIVEKYKYLGIMFNAISRPYGNPCREMVPYLADKALKASFATLRKVSSVGYVTPKIGLHLFDTCVLPILDYASEIWSSGKKCDRIERAQVRFLKLILGVKNSTCTIALYGEMGRFPIVLRHKVKLIKYWLRIQALPDSALVKQMYIMLKNLDDIGFKTWATNVKDVLCEYGFEHYWYQDSIPKSDIQVYVTKFKECVFTKFVSSWNAESHKYDSLRTFIQYKTEFRMESYLLNITDWKIRKIISQFRLNSHILNIEKGRHTKPKTPECQRLCVLCHQCKVENEYHAMIECVFYADLRKTFFSVLKQHDPNILHGNVFNNIMKSKDSKVQFGLGKFLQKLFKKRQNGLAEGFTPPVP